MVDFVKGKSLCIAICIVLLLRCLQSSLADDAADKKWCIEKRTEYSVEPGKSFGKLPPQLHGLYLSKKCHRFFCKPHPLAGKGVFPCESLDDAMTPP